MSVEPPPGSGSGSGRLPGAPPPSAAAVRLISALAPDHPARHGWVTGRVQEVLGAGVFRIGTPQGSLLIHAPQAQAEVGASLQLRLSDGAAQLRPTIPGGAGNAGGGQAPPPAPAPLAPSPAPALPLSLASLAPVQAGAAAAQGPALQALGAMFPQAGAPSFPLIAALFPVVAQDGTLHRLTQRASGRGRAPDARLAGVARGALDMQSARISDHPTARRWTLPFFTDGQLDHARWEAYDSPGGAAAGALPEQHVLMEAEFAHCGKLRLHALRDGRGLRLHMASERPVSAARTEAIRTLGENLAAALGCAFGMSTAVGELP